MPANRFYLRPSQSPTYDNLARYLQELGWHSTRFNWLAKFTEQNFQFDQAAAETLEFKHLLAQLVTKYCPKEMPLTYRINDANWNTVLNTIAEKFYQRNQHLVDRVNNLAWILKPSLLNNGQNIKIFHELSQIEQHYLFSQRLGGEHVLQKYITQPDLIDGKKYSIRMFVVITNYAGAYIYPQGYANVALHAYQANQINDLSSHLTNEHLRSDESNVVQTPSDEIAIFPQIYPQIKSSIADTLSGLKRMFPQAFTCQKKRNLAIFGFDFMVDADKRLWLLEANHGPCFPTTDEHPLQKKLYFGFWQAFINSFVVAIARRQPIGQIHYHMFERIWKEL